MRWRLFILTACAWAAGHAAAADGWRDGDIIFHTSRSSQSAAIQRATHSPYSHVGVVFFRDGKPYVFEAIATVRYTPDDPFDPARWWRNTRDSMAVAREWFGILNAVLGFPVSSARG